MTIFSENKQGSLVLGMMRRLLIIPDTTAFSWITTFKYTDIDRMCQRFAFVIREVSTYFYRIVGLVFRLAQCDITFVWFCFFSKKVIIKFPIIISNSSLEKMVCSFS